MAMVHRDLDPVVDQWHRDPRKAAQKPLQNITGVRLRLTAAAGRPPQERWAPLAAELDPRLIHEGDCPALASLMQDVHAQGQDVATATCALEAVDACPRARPALPAGGTVRRRQ